MFDYCASQNGLLKILKGPQRGLALVHPPLWSFTHDYVHAERKGSTTSSRTRSCNSTSSVENRWLNTSVDCIRANAFGLLSREVDSGNITAE